MLAEIKFIGTALYVDDQFAISKVSDFYKMKPLLHLMGDKKNIRSNRVYKLLPVCMTVRKIRRSIMTQAVV